MDRLTKKERLQALHVIMDEGAPDLTARTASKFLDTVEVAAITLHRLYTKACNGELSEAGQARADEIERTLRGVFQAHGLGLYLNSDPRGNPVGILTPKTGRYNTLGGAECGWRL